MEPPDFVVLLGARLGFGMGGRSGAIIPRSAGLAQIDIDGATLGRLQDVDIPIVADCREAMQAMIEVGRDIEWPDRAAWAQKATGAGGRVRAYTAEQHPHYGESGRIHPYHEIARAFGGHGEQVERLEDIALAIECALASGKASCINLLVDGDAITESIAALTMSDNPEAEIPIPYYEAVPIVK